MSKSVDLTLQLAMYVDGGTPVVLGRLSSPVEFSVLAADERTA
jgi:hypothetical protein